MVKGGRACLDHIATGALVVCAVAITAMVALREMRTYPDADGYRRRADWMQFVPPDAQPAHSQGLVTIVTFSDYQCPACRELDTMLHQIVSRDPSTIRLVHRHLPLPMHTSAVGAARASECGALQGRFTQLDSVLYAHQDSIGRWPWEEFALRGGVPDQSMFMRCMAHDTEVDRRIRADTLVAAAAGFRSTPTVFVNDIFFAGAPPKAVIEDMIEAARRGNE